MTLCRRGGEKGLGIGWTTVSSDWRSFPFPFIFALPFAFLPRLAALSLSLAFVLSPCTRTRRIRSPYSKSGRRGVGKGRGMM